MMKTDTIKEIGIDKEERLYVKPSSASFPMIYREAIEVHWDKNSQCLYGAKPRKWSYSDWYKQIISGASMQGTNLKLYSSTQWVNVPTELQQEIEGL